MKHKHANGLLTRLAASLETAVAVAGGRRTKLKSKPLQSVAGNGGRNSKCGGRRGYEYRCHEPQDAPNGRSCVL